MTAPLPTTASQAASVAAEAVRALNHLTLDLDGYTWPADVDAVIGDLLTVAYRLPQAFDQASTWLTRAHAAGRVGHDTPGFGTPFAVEYAVQQLAQASKCAAWMADALNQARHHTTHLTGIDPTGGRR
jgi:hypothetical protein